jgi:bacillithiol system protein YtxJ
MNWNYLQTAEQLAYLKKESFKTPYVIFKHSTRCSVSNVAKSRLERSSAPPNVEFHILDLLKYRSISNAIADEFGVWHESPQVLIIKDGKCIYDESHAAIDMDQIKSQLN